MSDFAAWKEQASADEVSVPVCFDRKLLREFHEASDRLQAIRVEGMLEQPDDVKALAQRVVDLHEQVKADEARHTFVFRCVVYDEWAAAVNAHQPTAEQQAKQRYIDFNPVTFPPVAVALACREPELSVDDAEWLRQNLPREEFDRLFDAAWQANVGGSSIPKPVSASVARLASGLRSTTQPP